jgi:hypothetical protein
MARTRTNALTKYYSGLFDNAVMTSDGTLRSRPDVSKRVWSPKQKAHLERLERAKEFGRMAISDPLLNEYYARKAINKRGLGAWHIAVGDCYKLPVITKVDFTDFINAHGSNQIRFEMNKWDMKEVRVSIVSAGDGPPEEGIAEAMYNPGIWQYKMRSHHQPAPGLAVAVRAEDIPGNVTGMTIVYPFDCTRVIDVGCDTLNISKGKRKKSQLRKRGK